MDELMKHQTRKSHEMQACQRSRQPLIVASQTPNASHPGEGAFDHPAPGQKHEAALGLGQLHHHQLDAFFLARRWLISRFAAAVPRALRTQLPLALGVAGRPGSSAAYVESTADECSGLGASSRWRITTA